MPERNALIIHEQRGVERSDISGAEEQAHTRAERKAKTYLHSDVSQVKASTAAGEADQRELRNKVSDTGGWYVLAL